ALVVISPMTMTIPVVVAVSQATRLIGSFSIRASKMASEMASHILSGWPSVTDSDVNNLFSIIFPFHLSFTHSGIRMFFLHRKGPAQADPHMIQYESSYCSINSLRLAPSAKRGCRDF